MAGRKRKKTKIGPVLKEIREDQGLSQDQVGVGMDVGRSYVSLLETNQRYPSLDTLIRFADACGVQPAGLFEKIVSQYRSEQD